MSSSGNVLNNALKFLEGRERRIVRVAIRAEEGRWGVLSVEDTGPGIPDASLQKLFQPFYRVPGTRISGTGIGLATVDRIVRAHGGQVRVASVAGSGTRFEIRLPLSGVEEGSRAV
jgi:signal transduction histidine kinase